MARYTVWKDHRWVYLLVLICGSVPFIAPIGLPITVTWSTKQTFELIEKVPKGHIVAFSNVITAGTWPETGPIAAAIIQHIFKRGIRLVIIGFRPESPQLVEDILARVNKYGAKEGVDYVHLGFIPGEESAYAAFANNPQGIVSADFKGTPISQLPLMKEVKTLKDFEIAIHLGGPDEPVRQYYTPFKVPVIVLAMGMMGPFIIPYVQSGQVAGMLVGLTSAAEYEALVGFYGEALKRADCLSLTHLLIFCLVILGNITYLYSTWRVKKKA